MFWTNALLQYKASSILHVYVETRPDGAGGPSGHRHAVHLGFGSSAEHRPERLLQTVLLQDQGQQSVSVCVFVVAKTSSPYCPPQTADKPYQDAFDHELGLLKERVRSCAQIRMECAMKELQEEERKKRLGPGGLDPGEVYESLPKVNMHMQVNTQFWMFQAGQVQRSTDAASYDVFNIGKVGKTTGCTDGSGFIISGNKLNFPHEDE